MKQRNHAFDLLCGLCILRMIMLHVVSSCGYRNEFWFAKLMAWTFFFMSFFFFKAGYFNKGTSGETIPYLIDRVKRLLIPYISWGVIGSIIYFAYLFLFPENFQRYYKMLRWSHLWEDSHVWGNPPVWFLFSFFMSYILVHFIQKVKHLRWIAVSFPFISYFLWKYHNPLWMSIDNVFMGVFFFLLGRGWRWLQGRVEKKWLIVLSILLIAEFVVGNRLWHGEYDMSLNKFVQNPWGAGINTICALVGISGLLLALPLRRIPVVGYIGEHSMIYFTAHYPLLYIFTFTHLVFRNTVAYHWEDVILMMLFILITCTWITPYLEKVPWLSGRYKKKIVTSQS
ncbi:MAG: acyltransferase [Bacteroidales bacterium]|nr:acyltransferase [Bacteroidales bacterium]